MKKLLLNLSMLTFIPFGTFAQETLFEADLKNDVNFNYQIINNSTNLFIWNYNKTSTLIYNYFEGKINKNYEIDKKYFLCNHDNNNTFAILSKDEITFVDPSIDSKKGYKTIKQKQYNFNKNYLYHDYLRKLLFNKNFLFSIVNRKSLEVFDNNFNKDEFSLLKYDLNTNKESKIDIVKPNVDRLLSKDLIEVKQLAYLTEVIDDNSFHIITKSVKKDLSSTTIYRTIYDFNGKQINEIKYEIDAIKGNVFYSDSKYNSGKALNTKQLNNGIYIKPYDFIYSNHFYDASTGDFYVYGISANGENPIGYYIYKYDKIGNLIWKNFYEIKDNEKRGFNNSPAENTNVGILLSKESDNKINISAFRYYHKMTTISNNLHLYQIDNSNGKVDKYIQVEDNGAGEKEFKKNLYISINTQLLKEIFPKITNYLNSLNVKEKTSIQANIIDGDLLILQISKNDFKVIKL